MDSSINFTPKRFSKRLSRNSNIPSISEVTQLSKQLNIQEDPNGISSEKLRADENTDLESFCLYCQESHLDCLVKCKMCKNVFCNSGIKDSSHIYLHSKFLGHNSYELMNYEKNENYDPNFQPASKNDLDKLEQDKENLGLVDDHLLLEQHQKKLLNADKRFNPTLMKCAHCANSNFYQLSFIIINGLTKELINLKTDYVEADKLKNSDKKVIFFCSGQYARDGSISPSGCFKELQQNLFEGFDIEEDFIKPIFNCYDKGNKFGFKKFFVNRLLLKDNSNSNFKLIYNQLNLCHIYTIETERLKNLKKLKLKRNDVYNFIDENNDYQFFDSENETDSEDEDFEAVTKSADPKTASLAELENNQRLNKNITSPLLLQENELLQNKTNSLKKIAKMHLSKVSVYENFKLFAFHHLNLMYKEQYAMLSLSSTSHKLSNNMVFVPYKKVTFEAGDLDVTIRLNTNYNLPILKINQVLGLKHTESGRCAFAVIKQIPNNSFNPEIKLQLLRFKNLNNKEINYGDFFIDSLETTLVNLNNRHSVKGSTGAFPQPLNIDKVTTNYAVFNIIPFDLVFSRIVDIIFQILTGKTQMNDFLMNLILGKNFENFEFSLSSFKSNNIYNENFNLSQRRAIDNLDSNKIVLIKGQVGTGKTIVSSTIIKNLIEKDMSPILVCSGANSTVDNLCERFHNDYVLNRPNDEDEILISRLVAPLKENQYNINHKIGGLCFHNFILANAPEELINLFIKNKFSGNNMSPKNLARLNKFYKDFFQQQDVIFTTCYNSGDPKLKDVKFKSIIVDDCSTTMNLLTLVPLAKNCDKLVLIGDDKQLNPYIHDLKLKSHTETKSNESVNGVAEDKDIGCNFLKQSLFQRILYNKLVKPIVLTEQYRMVPKLAEFPKSYTYNNELINGITNVAKTGSHNNSKRNSMTKRFPWYNQNVPIVFWDQMNCGTYKENEIHYHKKINNIENFFINQKTYQNYDEAMKIIKIIKDLHFGCGVNMKDIGVITPYVGQRVLLVQLIGDEFASYYENGNGKRNSKRMSGGGHHRRNSSMGGNNNRLSYNGNGNGNGNNSNKRVSYTNNRNIINQFQQISTQSNDFLFENHNPNEYELSVIEKVKNIEIGSIDSFQGKEKEYVIFSTVKSERIAENNLEELKILDDYRRLNVGITRSRKGLIVIGNSKILSEISHKHWGNYLGYLYEMDCVVEGPEPDTWKCTYKEHLSYLRR